MSSTTLTVRTDKDLKDKVGKILHEMGLNHSTAINLFYHKVLDDKGIPFDLKITNPETIKALTDSRNNKNLTRHENTDKLFEDLGI